jgi:glutamate N-acetyltransferase/amino-acid N-acetyltransferase
VPGFRASGIHCGIKEHDPDLALIASDRPAVAAGLFTRSSVVGAPVVVSRSHLRAGRVRAIVANSGIANVARGARGLRDARTMAALAARALGCKPEQVLVASTGVIGEPLPMGSLRRGILSASEALRADGLPRAARAIMTTDTRPKWASAQIRLAGTSVRLAGIAKGAGMIEPRMATMLAFLFTDAVIAAPILRRLLRRACQASFERISVDGETSTSDMVVLLANGHAGHAALRSATSPDARRFAAALERLCISLAQELVRDGEGATKFVTVRVRGARSAREAERAGRRIANSPLVKTALFGGDPNWGRILQAVGAAEVRVDLERATVYLADVPVFRAGVPAGASARRRAQARLRAPEIELAVDLAAGHAQTHLWTCDLSYDYVRINAEYST